MIHELLFCISLFIVFYGRIFIRPFSHLAKCVLKLEHGCCSVPNKQVSQCGAERRWQEVCSRYSGAAAGLGVPFSLSFSLSLSFTLSGPHKQSKSSIKQKHMRRRQFSLFLFSSCSNSSTLLCLQLTMNLRHLGKVITLRLHYVAAI